MLIPVFLIILCVILYYFYWRDKSINNVPLCDKYLPIIGHTHLFIGNTKRVLRTVKSICEDTNDKGGVTVARLALQDYYVITDPVDNLKIANGTFLKHFAYRFTSHWLGDGLITSSGETWKRHRKLLNPAFNQQILNSFIGVFNDESRKLVSEIGNEMAKGPVEVTTPFRQMAFRLLFLTAFGIPVEDSDFNQKYIHSVDKLLSMLIYRFQNVLLHNSFIYKISGLKKKEEQIVETVHAMSNMIIKRKREASKNKSPTDEHCYDTTHRYKSILDLLLKGLDGDALTDKEIRDEVDTIIVAGYDTSSWVLTLVMMALGSYPEIQNKVYQEVSSMFGDSEADVDKSHYPGLVYVEAVLKETLRLYPIVPIALRQTESDIELKNYTIPADSNCVLGIYGLNRHPVWGPDAHTFRPERWLEPGGVPDDPNAFAGFSVGKRTCIGKVYALMSMKTTLVHLIRRYKVTADISKVEFKMDVLMTPVNNCNVKFELRK
ncbi:cytochrome P450 4c21-like isoform X1 [Bombyx mori]|uniref:Cytochrome P450 n=2 Tax=Bombyx mori TaxID=7091 RepID=L0N760_BOMMO|nr:cytochrome P450 4c21-like [Bombyx mori]BAM73881.1 cytochrome P450 [Bombyx mori]BAM73882.1 cytochrome P450 [Bombyx mori]